MPRTNPAPLRRWLPVLTLLAAVSASLTTARAAEPTGGEEFLAFIKAQADELRKNDRAPADLAAWKARKAEVRAGLLKSWGGFPESPCPLEPKTFGSLKRDGYTVEKVAFQTRPGVWMTANAYVPDSPGKHPAILHVHGHWRGAKQDPVVQSRCIGAARLGFFVLVVDAFGAGERGVGKALGEYHGEMTGATLLPLGLPLSGLQVYENMRAVDYLKTRPEVDGNHIGVTGASGGGNQSMYAGAWDERLGAAVPVCSVGNYRAYLGIACCICELVPGAVRFAEESDVLGLVAPRALMVVNATRDAFQFSVPEAKKSLAATRPVFELFGHPERVRHAVFESGHDYNKDMRQAMYGWMTLHLKGQGDGSPVDEKPIKTEDPETLRCFPGETRPDDFVTLPRFAAAESRRLLAARHSSASADAFRSWAEAGKKALSESVLHNPEVPASTPAATVTKDGKTVTIRFEPEPGLHLSARLEEGAASGAAVAVVLNLDGAKAAQEGKLAAEFRRQGWAVVTMDVRATGALAWKSDKVGNAPDHNTAEWAAWIGRPLLGQWCVDVRRLIDELRRVDGYHDARVVLAGEGPAGLVALSAAALDPRVSASAAVGTLASYVSDTPYRGQRLGVLAPGILREVGDVAELAALSAPRRVVVAGGVTGDGSALGGEALRTAYQRAVHGWSLLGAPGEIRLNDRTDARAVVDALK